MGGKDLGGHPYLKALGGEEGYRDYMGELRELAKSR